MKLIVLAVVVSIAVFRASCRERPQGRDLNDVERNLSDGSNLPEYSDFSNGDDLYYNTDLPAGPKDEATTVEPDAFSGEPVDLVSTTDVDMAFPTIEFGPELIQGGFQNYNSSDIDHQWRKDGTVQNGRKLRGGSKCKSDIICSLLGGSCVSDSTFCSGREVLSICGGAKCKCCFTVNMEVKMHELEDVLRTMVVNLTVANANINTGLESLMNFMISSNSSQATVNSNIKNDLEFIIGNVTSANSNMQSELQFIKENFTVAIANQGRKLDSITKNLESLMNFMISSNSSQANLDQKINSLMSTNSNLTIANSNIKNDLEFIIGNVTSANSNMQNELQFIKENFTVAIANQGRTLDSIRKNQGTGCPEGLFLVTRTNQCLRIVKESKLTYDASKAACKQLGLELAVISEPISLRNFLVTKYGLNDATWLGCRGDGSNMKWERTGVVIPMNSPLWEDSTPPDTSRSLCILTSARWMKSKPYQPYNPCRQNDRYHPLCELVREYI